MKPVIEVHHGYQPPTIVVPLELAGQVEVRLIDDGAEDQRVLTHQGVSVYHAMKDLDLGGDSYMVTEYWYATRPWVDSELEEAFDIRDLPAIPEAELPKYRALYPDDEAKQTLAYAVDTGEIKSEEA